jgi:N-acetylglucosamine repressor
MRSNPRVESTLLRRINERRLMEVLQEHGPSSRAALTRASGLTAPTVSKAVETLLRSGLLEELDPPEQALGRPGRLVRMAADTAAVLGVVVDVQGSCVVAAGLDGRVTEEQTRRLPTPATYPELVDRLDAECRQLIASLPARILGIGVSVPGLVNDRLEEVVVSPNLHLLDGRNPARDLEQRLGIPCVLLQETDALCLGERMYGAARGRRDFAMLDVHAGLGLGVMSGGQLLAGHSGMAGEIGHTTVVPDGIRCGCGNRGCLETLATDSALVRMLEAAVGGPLDLLEARRLLDERSADFQHEVRIVTEYLAIAIAAVINIFNPTTLFVHGTLLAGTEPRFARVVERVRQRTLTASLAECTLVATRSSKRQGAIAGIIHHLTAAWAPAIR